MYNISISENEGIVEIVLAGELERDSIDKLTNEVLAIVKPMNAKKLLVDIRTLKGHFGYIEAYLNVRNFSSSFRGINITLVDIPENAIWESFHERTAINAGVSFKWFTDIDAARAWLKSQ
jgi:hypothetical protein